MFKLSRELEEKRARLLQEESALYEELIKLLAHADRVNKSLQTTLEECLAKGVDIPGLDKHRPSV